MTENNLLSLIIFAPLAGAVINWLIGGYLKDKPYSEMFSGLVACGTIAISTIVAFMIAFGIGTPHAGVLTPSGPTVVLDHLWTWIQVGGFRADFALGMDRLSGIYACFVTFVGLLIHIFATGYMSGDKGFYRFFAYMNLFMFSMLTLVLADNFLLMFVGWEGVGLCSYLLIGYYLKQDVARKAAKKAFVMNRIGDWGVLIGIFLIFTLTGTISFWDKSVDGTHVASALNIFAEMAKDPFGWKTIFAGGVTSVAVLLFIGATGKSAQIPLFTWLPDAMAGPTPVSALIHAATMVTAGALNFFPMMMGWLAICGIPIWAGFFSKDEILYRIFAAPNLEYPFNYIFWGVGLLTAVLTAVYMTRLMVMTFWGEERFQLELPEDSHT